MTKTGLDLAGLLACEALDAEIVSPGQPTPTVTAAAAALGVRTSQIIKSLIFSDKSGAHVLVIARGDRKIDRRKLSEHTVLRGLELAPPDVVLATTGYPVGGVPPIGHAQRVHTVLDQSVLAEPVVFGGGGTDDTLLRIRPDDIRRLMDAVVADVTMPV
jgi:Cys-tRNA(Pro) deacylase